MMQHTDVVDIYPEADDSYQEPERRQGPPARIPPARPHVEFARFPHRGSYDWENRATIADALAKLEAADPQEAARVRAYLEATEEDPRGYFTERGPLDPAEDHGPDCQECNVTDLATQYQAWIGSIPASVIYAVEPDPAN